MSRKKFSDTLTYSRGYISGRPLLDEGSSDYATEGSHNILFTGEAALEPFKGLALVDGIGAISGGPPGGFGLPPTFILTVSSENPSSGVAITVSPSDLDGSSNGTT